MKEIGAISMGLFTSAMGKCCYLTLLINFFHTFVKENS